jgi:hypothetical protein
MSPGSHRAGGMSGSQEAASAQRQLEQDVERGRERVRLLQEKLHEARRRVVEWRQVEGEITTELSVACIRLGEVQSLLQAFSGRRGYGGAPTLNTRWVVETYNHETDRWMRFGTFNDEQRAKDALISAEGHGKTARMQRD